MPHLLPLPVIEHLVGQYGYWGVFLLVGLENAGLPLPGEIVLVTAAVVAGTTHDLDISLVVAAGAAGGVLGANIGYWLGREFGFHLVLRFGRHIGIGERQLKLGQFLFLRHGGKVVFFGRLVAVLRVLAAILAGINRMPWVRFLAANVGGGLLWAGLYGGGAYLLGRRVHRITGPTGFITLGLGVIGVLIAIHYVRGHQKALEDAAERAFPGPMSRGRKRPRP